MTTAAAIDTVAGTPSVRNSLEQLAQATNNLDLSQKPASDVSSTAAINLPESENSSVTWRSPAFQDSYNTAPFLENPDGPRPSSQSPTQSLRSTSERGAVESTKKEVSSSPGRYAAYVEDAEDEEPETHGLSYKSQASPRRYFPSAHWEPLLSPALPSGTSSAELSSQNVKSPDPALGSPALPDSTANLASHTPSSSYLEYPEWPRVRSLRPESVNSGLGRTLKANRRRPKEMTSPEAPAVDIPTRKNPTNEIRVPGVPLPGSRNLGNNPFRMIRRPVADPSQEAGNEQLDGGPLITPQAVHNGSQLPPENANPFAEVRRELPRADQAPLFPRQLPPPPPFSGGRQNRIGGVRRERPVGPLVLEYHTLVDRLATHMPQLVNVRGLNCRQPNSGNIFCYDSLLSGGLPVLVDHISYNERKHLRIPLGRVKKLNPDRARNVRLRYILVEDLSPRIIEQLGVTFWLNPEFFEEHLNRSGYRPESYSDPTPSTWNTNATPKDFFSVRWFRPVRRARIKPLSEIERDTLLMKDHRSGTLKWLSSSKKGHFENTVHLETNIFRKEWPIVSDPDQAVWEEDDGSTFPVAWEERATVQVSQIVGRPPVFILLLDPLPTLHFRSQKVSGTRIGPLSESNLIPFLQAHSRAPMGPKLGLVDVFDGRPLDENTIAMLGARLASTNCTREDLTSWLESVHDVQPYAKMDLTTALLWIIHRDVTGFLDFVNNVLEEVGLNASDDYIIQKRLSHWRSLITQFQTELPAIRLSIKSFFDFLSQFQQLSQARGFIETTLEKIDLMIEKNEKSHAALRADMALLESKRAIDQAESVSKLTTLGFIFIPISCIATLFSMQIQPLAQPAPLSSFVITAVLTIGIIFSIRLGIRSTSLIEYRRETSRKIRLQTNLPHGAPIPTRTFISYMLRDRKLYLTVLRPLWEPIAIILAALAITTALMLPVIFLWITKKNMDVGYKSTLTIIFFLVTGAVVFPVLKGALQGRRTYLKEGRLLKRLRRMTVVAANDDRTANIDSDLSSDGDRTGMSLPAQRGGRFRNLGRLLFSRRVKRRSDSETPAPPERVRIPRSVDNPSLPEFADFTNRNDLSRQRREAVNSTSEGENIELTTRSLSRPRRLAASAPVSVPNAVDTPLPPSAENSVVQSVGTPDEATNINDPVTETAPSLHNVTEEFPQNTEGPGSGINDLLEGHPMTNSAPERTPTNTSTGYQGTPSNICKYCASRGTQCSRERPRCASCRSLNLSCTYIADTYDNDSLYDD